MTGVRPRNLAILAAAVVALGAFLWLFERGLPGSEERAERAKLLLPELAGDGAGEVTAVGLEAGGERVRLVRVEAADDEAETADGDAEADLAAALGDLGVEPEGAEGEWTFAEPPVYAGRRADAQAVADLLSALAGVAKERDLDDVEPVAVGLDAPRAQVVLEREDGAAIELAVGGEVPASHHMVVAVAGREGAYLVYRGLYDDLTRRRAGDWRARDLFPAARRDVAGLTVEGEAGRVVLERDGDRFRVAAAAGGAAGGDVADSERVDELLAALTGLTAVSFVDDPDGGEIEAGSGDEAAADALAARGLAPPRGTVIAALDGGGSFRVEVGGETDAGTVHLRVGEQVVTARTRLGEAVDRAPAGWASRRLTELRPFEIERLVASGADAAMTLERDGSDWLRDGVRIGYAAVSDLLYAIADLRAEEVLARADVRLRAPELSVELGGAAPEGGSGEGEAADDGARAAPAVEAFHLHASGGDGDGRVAATVDGRDRVLLLDAAMATDLRDKLAAVRAAEPLPEASEEALPDGVEVVVEEGDGEPP